MLIITIINIKVYIAFPHRHLKWFIQPSDFYVQNVNILGRALEFRFLFFCQGRAIMWLDIAGCNHPTYNKKCDLALLLFARTHK